MQKPNYIKLHLPATKKDFSPAVLKVFKKMQGSCALIDFGEYRQRKTFKYSIISVSDQTWTTINTREKSSYFVLRLVKI